ncbi:hypothetical protein PG999_006176 [Apiospora kogelbergensis]|uniref:Uncharacterized protein n=1 Tax=Apiospora kogelbergensis TaxID=1337665 RepID=A0AAW0QQS7_9PEZI
MAVHIYGVPKAQGSRLKAQGSRLKAQGSQGVPPPAPFFFFFFFCPPLVFVWLQLGRLTPPVIKVQIRWE